jgi:hypothetical protein
MTTADPVQLSGNPLQLRGLVLAGANRRGKMGPDDGEGVLTAEELATRITCSC